MFNAQAEQKHWEHESAEPPDPAEFDFLYGDMKHWVPSFPEVFHGKRVLDLGAGRGLLGVIVAERCGAKQCFSVDLGFHRLRACSSWTRTLQNFALVCGDAFSLPFADNSFDLVVANSLLHHFPELDRATAEISRVLRRGGRYIGREPNWNNPVVRTHVFKFDGTWLRRYERVSANEYPLRPRQIDASFKRAGCACNFAYFWRRWKYLRHPKLSIGCQCKRRKARRLSSCRYPQAVER